MTLRTLQEREWLIANDKAPSRCNNSSNQVTYTRKNDGYISQHIIPANKNKNTFCSVQSIHLSYQGF